MGFKFLESIQVCDSPYTWTYKKKHFEKQINMLVFKTTTSGIILVWDY